MSSGSAEERDPSPRVTAKPPGAPLRPFVELFWHSAAPPGRHARERCLPTGTMELVINLREDVVRIWDSDDPRRGTVLPGGVLCGPHAEHFVIDTDRPTEVVGVHFRPGGGFAFLAVPAREVRDLHVPLEDLWGRSAAAELRETVLLANGPGERLAVLERFLAARLAGARRHPAVPEALRRLARGGARVGELAESLGLSARRLNDLFAREVGLGPKACDRVLRFQRVLDGLERECDVDWADLALDCGYFDQAHLAHEVRSIAGASPTELARLRGPHRNHLPIAEA